MMTIKIGSVLYLLCVYMSDSTAKTIEMIVKYSVYIPIEKRAHMIDIMLNISVKSSSYIYTTSYFVCFSISLSLY